MKQSTSVLFVCLGNICRSPTAEAVFKHKAAQAGLILKLTQREPTAITLVTRPISVRKPQA